MDVKNKICVNVLNLNPLLNYRTRKLIVSGDAMSQSLLLRTLSNSFLYNTYCVFTILYTRFAEGLGNYLLSPKNGLVNFDQT